MQPLDRREFVQAVARLGAVVPAAAQEARAGERLEGVQVERPGYRFQWEPEGDRLRLLDRQGREMVRSPLQPAVVVESGGVRRCRAGRAVRRRLDGDTLTVHYEGVNGDGELEATWRFGDFGLWVEPVVYKSARRESVVAVAHGSEGDGREARPALDAHYLVLPGVSVASTLSPIRLREDGLDVTCWLGHGDYPGPGPVQGWGLPVHYFCGFLRDAPYIGSRGALGERMSHAFCCGLAELPPADLLFRTAKGRGSAVLEYRGDVWGHGRGPGQLKLGGRWYWGIGENWREAIQAYYRALLREGIVRRNEPGERKRATLAMPQFNTWGEAVAVNKPWDRFDEGVLTGVHRRLKESGLRAGLFVIDAKWEGRFGSLEHDEKRFPHFEEIVGRIRGEGYRIGLWAAFLRCERPEDLGLDERHMLRAPGGGVFAIGEGAGRYYIADVSQAEVRRAVAERARSFVRRYRPDLVKLDFGYEIPSLGRAAPLDLEWAGERFFRESLRVAARAMREVDPEIVILYQPLSPLLAAEVDQFSLDDLAYCPDDYALEANRRIFFGSLLGELGIPTHGSSGYDWESAPSIWFDSAVSGTLGCLVSLSGDPYGKTVTPEIAAKYNGLKRVLRGTPVFTVEPVGANYTGPVRGGRSASWVRWEEGKLVLAALRCGDWDGAAATSHYGDVVSSDAGVVVASKTPDGLGECKRLGIVPYGEGTLTLRRSAQKRGPAEVREHYFGGGVEHRRVSVEGGQVLIPLRERNQDAVVEWIEVVFS